MPLVNKSFSDIITFTRASAATYFDANGVMQSATTNAPRFDYSPATLAPRGLLIEEQRTNSIRNNTMVGAVAGTPGTLPTNWLSVTGSGISYAVIGTGSESGISYIDLRISGTTTAALFLPIRFEQLAHVAASPNSVWTHSVYMTIVGGSTANVSAINVVIEGRVSSAVITADETRPSITTFIADTLAVEPPTIVI